MNLKVKDYIDQIKKKYETGHAREHAYRPALEKLFEDITELNVVNDPKRSEYGSPDFVFMKGKTTIAYAEAKDVNISLDDIEKGEQMVRYYGYSNLILTNYLEFRFYRNGQKYCESIKLGEINNGEIEFNEDNYILLGDTIKDFINESREPIKSGIVLAKVMAGKARRIRDNINIFLSSEDDKKNENLLSIYGVIKKLLLDDLNYEKFADMYAQTVVYGLFVARYHDKSPENFSRQEARDLIPASNPFLRHFFDHITGASFDERIEIIVNELCEEFTNADVNAIIHDYYNVEKDNSKDPIVHFYEDFLKEYNPKERMSLGVFYTPRPVVKFIVNSINEILIKEFGLNGLVDSSKIEIPIEVQGKKAKELIHRVQVLDPATGTGTFLNETILKIKESFDGQEGRWSKYVKEDLLPRLHGFELMMAPYTIAHLKLSSVLKESGVDIDGERLGVYLTNSLEKGEEAQKTLFEIGLAKAITEESYEAGIIKNKLPIMVVMGNPPYSGESMNPQYTDNDVYKVEPGTKVKLQERNSKWINDDYVKFIRLAESLVEKTDEGVIGMITSHGYLDNPTFRGMRYHLMETFDKIYVFDLHGNANKKETGKNGEKDENVFDIKTGVSIILGIKKKGKSKKLAEVFRFDIFGLRKEKFGYLNKNSFDTIQWEKVNVVEPNYEFVIRDEKLREEYSKGFSINELFIEKSVGIVTAKDKIFINDSKSDLEKKIKEYFINKEINKIFDIEKIKKISYRPFDKRFVYYDVDLIERARQGLMKIFNVCNVLTLVSTRQVKSGELYHHVLVSENMVESTFVSNKTSEIGYVFPLYYYEYDNKISNLNQKIIEEIIKNIEMEISPEDIFNYIYAVLYSPSYREKYGEFLKIDFPKVPYPKNDKYFFELAKLGEKLIKIHLLEDPEISNFITKYPIAGDDKVGKVEYKDSKVFINKEQYFDGVSDGIWNFYIGGYQPAQKWLKDRKNKILSSEELVHYQKIIVSLTKTIELMKQIDKIV
ncbi:MAG: N-6 DNA methylase [Candidatus Pacebacteria bacterium]|nr:N-6 DNA methylase [Candidatus Paceibacterota bacterium]